MKRTMESLTISAMVEQLKVHNVPENVFVSTSRKQMTKFEYMCFSSAAKPGIGLVSIDVMSWRKCQAE
jgi:hypothetical protein